MTKLIPVFTTLTLLLFVVVVNLISDYAWSIAVTLFLMCLILWATYKYLKRKQLIEDLNRFESVYVVGMHPQSNTPPVLTDFAEDCEFVSDKDVNKVAEEWRKRLRTAKNPHRVKVYEFFLREPIDEEAVNEAWSAEKSENNYPARIVRTIKKDRAMVHVPQYNASKGAYRKIARGQTINFD